MLDVKGGSVDLFAGFLFKGLVAGLLYLRIAENLPGLGDGGLEVDMHLQAEALQSLKRRRITAASMFVIPFFLCSLGF